MIQEEPILVSNCMYTYRDNRFKIPRFVKVKSIAQVPRGNTLQHTLTHRHAADRADGQTTPVTGLFCDEQHIVCPPPHTAHTHTHSLLHHSQSVGVDVGDGENSYRNTFTTRRANLTIVHTPTLSLSHTTGRFWDSQSVGGDAGDG